MISCVMFIITLQEQSNTVLHYSAEFGHVEIAEMLIEKYGMDPDTESTVCSDIMCLYIKFETIHSYMHMYILCKYELMVNTKYSITTYLRMY